jgi:glutamyl-tRNA reductase
LQFPKTNNHTACITEEQKFQKHIHGKVHQKTVSLNENIARKLREPLIAQIQSKSTEAKSETLLNESTENANKRKNEEDPDEVGRKILRKALRKPITVKDLYKKLKSKGFHHIKISLKDETLHLN